MMKIEISDEEKKLWGSYSWYLLHNITHRSPCSKRSFFKHLGGVLPCPMCRDHYKIYLKKSPVTEQTDFRQWLINLHNTINVTAKKPLLVDIDKNYGLSKPIDHKKIRKLLEILFGYHRDEDTLDVFKEFLDRLKNVIPCPKCVKALANHTGTIEKYLEIVAECK